MRIGILVSSISNFGESDFYNSQEIGMAKALVKLGNHVVVYKLLHRNAVIPTNIFHENFEVRYSSVRNIGINGLVNVDVLDEALDALVYFADTQLSVPTVYKWCKRTNTIFVPYIGVIESHSTNSAVKRIMNMFFSRNLSVYKKVRCLVKNSDVARRLKDKGVQDIRLAPVGIDLDLLNGDYQNTSTDQLKKKYGFESNTNVILFIGRLVEEKRPLDMIEYFARLTQKDTSYRLLIVGDGVLSKDMLCEIERLNISDKVKWIHKIENEKIWELYCLCDCFVNLNKQEIFGMVLLEAMYYGAKVVAWHAPGPDYIIEHGKSGYLVNSEQDLYKYITCSASELSTCAHDRIISSMTWETTAKVICDASRKS